MDNNNFYKYKLLTNKAFEYQSRVMSGEIMSIKRAEIGDGIVLAEEVENLESLKNKICDVKILSVVPKNNAVELTLLLDGEGLTDVMAYREIGVYAEIDGEEILYAYLNSDNKVDYIMPNNGSTGEYTQNEIKISLVVGNAENITVTINNTVIPDNSITVDMLDTEIKNYINGINVKMQDIEFDLSNNKSKLNEHTSTDILSVDGSHGLRYDILSQSLKYKNNDQWITINTGKNAEITVNTHKEQSINSTDGIHGLRYNEERLEIKKEDGWSEINTGIKHNEIKLSNVKNLKYYLTDAPSIEITWSDPDDVTLGDLELVKWVKTKVIKKIGSPPENHEDGEILTESTTKNEYTIDGLIDLDVEPNTTYYYAVCPVDSNNNTYFDRDNMLTVENIESAESLTGKIYGFRISFIIANTNITGYTDDATRFNTPDDWDSSPLFKNIRPCVIKNSKVLYYLDPNDYSLKLDGRPSDLSDPDKKVMVEFPPLAYKVEWNSTDGSVGYVKICGDPNLIRGEEWHKFHFCHSDHQIYPSKFYVSAFPGTNIGGKITSNILGDERTIYTETTKNINETLGEGEYIAHKSFFQLLLFLVWLRYKKTDYSSIFRLKPFTNSGDFNYRVGQTLRGGLFTNCQNSAYYPNSETTTIKICGIEFTSMPFLQGGFMGIETSVANTSTQARWMLLPNEKYKEIGGKIVRPDTNDCIWDVTETYPKYNNSMIGGYYFGSMFNGFVNHFKKIQHKGHDRYFLTKSTTYRTPSTDLNNTSQRDDDTNTSTTGTRSHSHLNIADTQPGYDYSSWINSTFEWRDINYHGSNYTVQVDSDISITELRENSYISGTNHSDNENVYTNEIKNLFYFIFIPEV